MAYPVQIAVEPQITKRNRLTTGFRLILAIPHLLLIGGIGFSVIYQRGSATSLGGETGLLGSAAFLLAVVSWFTIVISRQHFTGIRQFTTFYLRWRVRGLAYVMLLEDQYPPFGDALYPASVAVIDPAGPRDRLTVGLRLLLVIPHAIVLSILLAIWWLTAIIAWVLILVTATYPAGLYHFGVGSLRWLIRVEAYVLLLTDAYPPFSLS